MIDSGICTGTRQLQLVCVRVQPVYPATIGPESVER